MERSQVIKKPWGEERVWAKTSKYAGKIITIRKGHRLSLQYHKQKSESILVLSGRLRLEIGVFTSLPDTAIYTTYMILKPGQSHHIRPYDVHRFSASFGTVRLLEISTPELHDVVRIADDYGRAI